MIGFLKKHSIFVCFSYLKNRVSCPFIYVKEVIQKHTVQRKQLSLSIIELACRSSIDCPLQILLHKTPCQRKYPSQRSNNARVAFLGHTDSKNAGEKRNISISSPTRVFYLYINVNCTHPFEIKTWNTKSLRRAAKVVGIWRPFCKLIRVLWNDAPAYEEAFPHKCERGPKRGIKLIQSEVRTRIPDNYSDAID